MSPSSPPQPDASDWSADLARVAGARDVDSFMRLYDHFAPRVKRYLLGLGVSPDAADELVQETLLRLWRRAADFDAARASPATWLFRIARNLHVDSLRRDARRAPDADCAEPVELDVPDDDGVGPDAFVDHRRLDLAIAALPAMQARLVRMSYLEARSHSEIADEMKMPLGSVKSTLRRAFAKLKSALVPNP